MKKKHWETFSYPQWFFGLKHSKKNAKNMIQHENVPRWSDRCLQSGQSLHTLQVLTLCQRCDVWELLTSLMNTDFEVDVDFGEDGDVSWGRTTSS